MHHGKAALGMRGSAIGNTRGNGQAAIGKRGTGQCIGKAASNRMHWYPQIMGMPDLQCAFGTPMRGRGSGQCRGGVQHTKHQAQEHINNDVTQEMAPECQCGMCST